MEEKIQKILNEKDENVVQFNVTNTTSNPIFLNLFNSSDLSVIPNTPTYLFPPNSVEGNLGIIAPIQWLVLANNGLIYADDGSTNLLIINPATNTIIGFIPLGIYVSNWLTYNSINNTIYIMDVVNNVIVIIDCLTNTISSVIPFTNPNQSAFNSVQNTLYVTTLVGSCVVIDCTTNTIITSIPLTCNYIEYNSTNNLIYTSDSSSSNITIIDCFTNTISGTIPLISPVYSLLYNVSNNTLLVSNNSGNDLSIIDCSTNLLIANIIVPPLIGTFTFGTIDTNTGNVYFGTAGGNSVIISTTTNTIINYFFVSLSPLATSVFVSSQNNIYIACPFASTITYITTAGITATPYYISGSANYNSFVNNLNNEPVFIQMVRLLVQNQNQLNNELQLTKIDSNGNQIFMPNFPINEVSAYQQQGNIGEITLKDIVFDGRTYINQYQLNAYESMSFEIYYKQLDLTTATASFPIFFKPKIQLKEYIRKDYSDYDVEM